jgi:transposase
VRENDGRKLDHRTLEAMRLRAVGAVLEQEIPVRDVAASIGMTPQAVWSWVRKYRSGGAEALKARPVPGAKPKLSPAQMRSLARTVLGKDPRQLRFAFALWTRDMVRELIEREFGVTMSLGAVGRLLRRLGLSPQRPLYRAYQQDPEAVERWKSEEYPLIKDEAAREGAVIYFLDEAAVRSDSHSGTTWAKRGQTPVVKATGARYSVNMISGVSAKGALRFMLIEGTLTAPVFIEFCKRLAHDAQRLVYLVVDGHPVHRSKAVKEYVRSTEGRLKLFFLPSYSPELNPDEWVWKNVKHDRVGRTTTRSKAELKSLAMAALRRLQRTPELVRGFFRDPDLAYIHA